MRLNIIAAKAACDPEGMGGSGLAAIFRVRLKHVTLSM